MGKQCIWTEYSINNHKTRQTIINDSTIYNQLEFRVVHFLFIR